MSFLLKAHPRCGKRQIWAIALANSLFICFAFTGIQANAAQAIEVPTTVTSVQHAPYSRVFFTGTTYMVKDRNYSPGDPAIGFFSTWSLDPVNRNLQVTMQYCLNDLSLADSNARLGQVTLLSNDQPLVTINQNLHDSAAGLQEVRRGFYESTDDDPFWVDSDPASDEFFDNSVYGSTLYVPEADCSAGVSQFDISNLADAIAQLPDQTLQVQLQFSDGRIEQQQLGHQTVAALKELVAIRQALTSSGL